MAEQEEKRNKEVAVADSVVAFSNLNEILAFGKEIIASGISPLKTPQDVAAAILFGRELGMPPMVSINNIYPINGKGSLSVHLINALLQKNGVVVEILRNYEPVFAYALKEDGGDKPALFKDGQVVSRNPDGSPPEGATLMFLREGFADETPAAHEVRGNKILGFKTVVRLTRKLKQLDGTYRETVVESSYSTMEAIQAGLMNNPKKENWVKYPKQMTLNRALSFGGRLIGADIMLGMYETSELADANNISYRVVDVDHIEVIQTDPTKSETTEEDGSASEVEE